MSIFVYNIDVYIKCYKKNQYFLEEKLSVSIFRKSQKIIMKKM